MIRWRILFRNSLHALPGKKEIWAVGERVQLLLSDAGLNATTIYHVPDAVDAITPLVQQILSKVKRARKKKVSMSFIFFIISQNRDRVISL